MAKDKHYTYYFCYGTPVSDLSLERRIDTLRLEGWGKLKGWKFDFSRQGNQPNITEDSSAETWGLMFLIEEKDLKDLDAIEAGGRRHEGKVMLNGLEEDAVYFSYPAQASGKPDEEFLKVLREGYRVSSLPQRQIDRPLGVTTVAR